MTRTHISYKDKVQLSTAQWQKARRMWRDGKDTHEIACELGCTEAYVYNGMYLLKLQTADENS
jgi:hypothetical protein